MFSAPPCQPCQCHNQDSELVTNFLAVACRGYSSCWDQTPSMWGQGTFRHLTTSVLLAVAVCHVASAGDAPSGLAPCE